MKTTARYLVTTAVVALTLISGLGCGAGASSNSVAQIGDTAITRADVNHWMSTLVGGDYYEVSKQHAVPASLVAEPADYHACVASLEAAEGSVRTETRKPASSAVPKPTASQLLTKCRQLYVALRLQTMAYLVSAQWTMHVDADVGVKASDAEVRQLLQQIKETEFPQTGAFQAYLKRNDRSLADEMLVVKLNVLSRKLGQKAKAVGYKQLAAKLIEAGQKWTAKTNCSAGSVVPHCRQFRKWRTIVQDPAVLLEQVAALTGLPCINREGCG